MGGRVIHAELPAEARAECSFFNSFFHKKLTEKSSGGGKDEQGLITATQRAFQRVKKWTTVSLMHGLGAAGCYDLAA